MSPGAAKENVKTARCTAMLDRFLHHPSRYRYKVEFVEFCVMKVLFSGRDEDVVLREDFIEAFRRHSGVSFSCNKGFVQHLVAAGVRVTRVIRRRVKEYYYVGLRLVDGEGRRFTDFMSGGRPGDATQDSDDDTKVGIQRTTTPNSPLTALDPSTTSSPLPAANTSEGRQLTTPKNGPPLPFDPSTTSLPLPAANTSEGRQRNTPKNGPPLPFDPSTTSLPLPTANTSEGRQLTTPKNGPPLPFDPSTTSSPLPTANTSEGRQLTTPKNGPPFPFDPSTTSTTPKKADESEGRPTNIAMQKLMNYPALHKNRDTFIRFCRDKIRFTGDLSDFVFRKDLFEEFRKFLGGDKPCQTAVGRHLVSTGVMVTRLGSGAKREYGYRGMCFEDGRGRKAAEVGALRTRRKSQGGRTETQKRQSEKSQGGRTETQKRQKEKSQGGQTQTQKKQQTDSAVQGLKGASHDQPSDQASTSTLNSPLHPPPPASVLSPHLLLSPIPAPSSATFPPTASSPTLSEASYSAPLDLSTYSTAPLDLSTSAPTQTPQNQHHEVFNTSDMPLTFPFPDYPNLSRLPPATCSLPPPPPAHANPQTPTITPLQAHVSHPQPAPSLLPTYTPVGTIRLLECALAYLTSPKMQEEIKTFYDSISTAEEGEEGEEMESN
ncbi:uncharacterized protein LOC126985548 isoform X2 [Eriocheir sinensis]|uniref:uncharacterized protein LOC126985548 isoform X2 n=1 Tax=Eriocheir sinensis TaxID=95602 RepID=UPI0021C599EF|nr:uncharacterized protein LOC126985548 isoform X2 [Eriocheir sinensis]